MSYQGNKKIVERVPGYYRLKGDDFWYREVIGPGPDIPMINIGPGPHPGPPVVIGPGGGPPHGKDLERIIEAAKHDFEEIKDFVKEAVEKKKQKKDYSR